MNQRQKQVFVFEDNEGIAFLTKESLEKDGYHVESASNGKSGLEILKKNSFDVILIDHDLPDITGLELFEEIKKIKPEQVCIMVTGSGDEKIAVKAIKAGMYDYIVKAVNSAHLATLPIVIEGALERQRLRKDKENYTTSLEKEVQKRTEELQKTLQELTAKTERLENFFRLTVGRELQMIELKKEINKLLTKLGLPKKYEVTS